TTGVKIVFGSGTHLIVESSK
uniref:Uncharacterized protein n=2 Tax=Cyprinus carpio TaxID=7962 RepID=A0A8C0YGG9_CYPCA